MSSSNRTKSTKKQSIEPIYVLLIIVVISLVGYSFYPVSNYDEDPSSWDIYDFDEEAYDRFIEGLDEFSDELFHLITKEKKGENVFYSPYSLKQALGLLLLGSDGHTSEDIRQALHLSDMERTTIGMNFLKLQQDSLGSSESIKSVNDLWADKAFNIKQGFLQESMEFFHSKSTNLDIHNNPEGSREHINKYIENSTEGKISDLLPDGSLDQTSKMIITNAIHFLGEWMHTFDEDKTKERDFTLLSGEKVKVPMMSQEEFFRVGKVDGVWALELPYNDEEFSMVIYYPEDMNTFDYTSIPYIDLDELHETKLFVDLPKFKFDTSVGLKNILKGHILSSIFEDCDVSFISDLNNLFVSEIYHQSFIEVNEHGTEAAAASGVVISQRSLPMTLEMNHPFIFTIQNIHSDEILFNGVVHNPTL